MSALVLIHEMYSVQMKEYYCGKSSRAHTHYKYISPAEKKHLILFWLYDYYRRCILIQYLFIFQCKSQR